MCRQMLKTLARVSGKGNFIELPDNLHNQGEATQAWPTPIIRTYL